MFVTAFAMFMMMMLMSAFTVFVMMMLMSAFAVSVIAVSVFSRDDLNVRLDRTSDLVHYDESIFVEFAVDIQLFQRKIQNSRFDPLDLADSFFYFSSAVSAAEIIDSEGFSHRYHTFI